MAFIGIIPARFASTRFPGKPLADIAGKSMIRRVYEQATKCTALKEVVVATDHERIYEHVQAFGRAVMTKASHRSGTDRCREAIDIIGKDRYSKQDVVVNIQGDEPFIHPLQIELLIGCFADEQVQVASLMKKIDHSSELFNENIVKVIVNKRQKAIYFSRSPIPFYRGQEKGQWLKHGTWFRHIGLYAYRIDTLNQIGDIPESPLEKAESLEQLRWIDNGIQIHMAETGMQHHAVDTPEDLEKILIMMDESRRSNV